MYHLVLDDVTTCSYTVYIGCKIGQKVTELSNTKNVLLPINLCMYLFTQNSSWAYFSLNFGCACVLSISVVNEFDLNSTFFQFYNCKTMQLFTLPCSLFKAPYLTCNLGQEYSCILTHAQPFYFVRPCSKHYKLINKTSVNSHLQIKEYIHK